MWCTKWWWSQLTRHQSANYYYYLARISCAFDVPQVLFIELYIICDKIAFLLCIYRKFIQILTQSKFERDNEQKCLELFLILFRLRLSVTVRIRFVSHFLIHSICMVCIYIIRFIYYTYYKRWILCFYRRYTMLYNIRRYFYLTRQVSGKLKIKLCFFWK